MRRILILLFFSGIFLSININKIYAQAPPDPQYIFVRKDPMNCNPSDCSMVWNMAQKDKITLNAINDVFDKIGTHGSPNRKVGIGVILYYTLYDNKNGLTYQDTKDTLRLLLTHSQTHQFPIFIQLDGYQFLGEANNWNGTPQIWNWFDSSKPGYDINNKNNVEWTCWDSSCAVTKAWRNWGSEFEVRPPPNYMSPALLTLNKFRVKELTTIISNWYNNELSNNEKWLLGGLSLGNEIDTGGNYYYYPNGVSNGQGIFGSVQLGYAAVKTAELRTNYTGGPPTTPEINEVIRRYNDQLNKTAYDQGIPRNKIFNQIGGFDLSPIELPPNINFSTTDAAVQTYGFPGWSFYGGVTQNPQNFPGIIAAINRTGRTNEWSVPEWLTYATTQQEWENAMRSTLNYQNNRFINIANWEGIIRDNPMVLQAIKTVANESPTCWVTSQVNTTISGNNITFNLIKGANNIGTYLQITTDNTLKLDATFANVNDNINLSTTNNTISYTKSGLSNGTYYYLIANDGCTTIQRRLIYGSFTISSFLISDLKNLLLNYKTNLDIAYQPIDQKVNMFDAGYVIKWIK